MDAFDDPATLHGDHLVKQAQSALGRAPAHVALPTLGADKHSRPSYAKSLRCRFMGLDLYFPTVCLRGTTKLLSHKIPRRSGGIQPPQSLTTDPSRG